MTQFRKLFHTPAIVITGILICLFLTFCSKEQPKKPEPLISLRVRPVHPGQIERFHCLRDTFFSYTAYTPKKYSDQLSWPVLFVFDPHAQGFLPVRRYQSLAESHNMLSTEYEQTQNQLQIFTAQNQKLIEKNRVAAEHTKLVLERLAKIDSEN